MKLIRISLQTELGDCDKDERCEVSAQQSVLCSISCPLLLAAAFQVFNERDGTGPSHHCQILFCVPGPGGSHLGLGVLEQPWKIVVSLSSLSTQFILTNLLQLRIPRIHSFTIYVFRLKNGSDQGHLVALRGRADRGGGSSGHSVSESRSHAPGQGVRGPEQRVHVVPE